MSDEGSEQPPAPSHVRTTPWAFASLLCSLGVFCPLLTLLGPLLGIKALAEIRSRPGTTGTGLAVAGIVIGLALTVGWVIAAVWVDRTIRQPLLHGPMRELQAGLVGDVAAFKAGFIGEGATADDATAAAFLSEVAGRYGSPITIMQDEASDLPGGQAGAISPIVPYAVRFEGAFIEAEAEFVIFDDREAGIIGKWRWVILRDPDLGDLAYPPGAFDMRRDALEEFTTDAPDQ